MWGSDYPHDEGTLPVHPRAPPQACSTTSTRPSPRHARRQRRRALRLRPRRPGPARRRVGHGRGVAVPLAEMPTTAPPAAAGLDAHADHRRADDVVLVDDPASTCGASPSTGPRSATRSTTRSAAELLEALQEGDADRRRPGADHPRAPGRRFSRRLRPRRRQRRQDMPVLHRRRRRPVAPPRRPRAGCRSGTWPSR